MNEQLRNLSAHVDAVREGERTSIAREIHDELGQVLTAIKMDVSWLKNRLPATELAQKTGETIKIIDEAIQSVKRISSELRPGILDDIGLAAAIEWATKEFQKRTGIRCTASIRPENLSVDRMRSTALFRILQESLTNIMRHAEASHVSVSLQEKNRKIVLTIGDNGKGIKKEEIVAPYAFGLIGMRERVQFLGGEVMIKGVHNGGTTVTVALPIDSGGKAG
jgi:signal transduction histidine kinase